MLPYPTRSGRPAAGAVSSSATPGRPAAAAPRARSLGGSGGLPFGGGVDVAEDEPDPTPVGGAVLERLQNGVVNDNLTDLWICSAPEIADVQGVAYAFLQNAGALVLVPNQGEPVLAAFASAETGGDTITNTYQDIDAVETMSGFAFSGTEAFSADSTLVGAIACERFFVDDGGTGGSTTDGGIVGGGTTGGDTTSGAQSVSASLENELTADGQPATIWACQGPQAGGDNVLYGFFDGSGLYVALREGQEAGVSPFLYVESSPGTLDLVYDSNSFEETLSGFVFTSATQFDMTSTSDGPLSCTLADVQ